MRCNLPQALWHNLKSHSLGRGMEVKVIFGYKADSRQVRATSLNKTSTAQWALAWLGQKELSVMGQLEEKQKSAYVPVSQLHPTAFSLLFF